jgi:secondary thiamine-phosphate synthase enzyme
MKQHQEELEVRTPGRGLHEITDKVASIVHRASIRTGLCTVFCCHTSASLVIQENADRTAKHDLLQWMARIAPDGDPAYTHDTEGDDDMAAHLRSAVTRTSEVIPIANGRLTLGTWQGIYLAEHRTRPHYRTLIVHVTGL